MQHGPCSPRMTWAGTLHVGVHEVNCLKGMSVLISSSWPSTCTTCTIILACLPTYPPTHSTHTSPLGVTTEHKNWRRYFFSEILLCWLVGWLVALSWVGLVFRDRVFLYNSGCPGTLWRPDRVLPALASQVLGLKVCSSTPSWEVISYQDTS